MTETQRKPFMLRLLCLLVATCTFGASAFSVDLGFFQLSIFRALFLLFVAFVLLNLIFPRKSGYVFRFGNGYSFYIGVWVFWCFYALTTFFWSYDFGNWFYACFYLFVGLFFLLFFSIVKFNKAQIFSILVAFNLSVFFQSIIGWYEVFSGNYFFVYGQKAVSYSMLRMPVATMNNTNDFATGILAGIFVCLMCICLTRKKNLIIFHFICIAEYSVLLTFTQSRANLLALILGVSFCLLIRRRKRLGLSITLVGGVFLIGFIIINSLDSRVGGSDNIRISLVLDGLDFLFDTYCFGIGAGQGEWWLMHRSSHAISDIYIFHNFWIEVLSCYGVLIFFLFLAMYINLFLTFFKKHMSKSFFEINCIASGYMIAFVLSSVSSSSLFSSEWIWVFIPILIALANSEDGFKAEWPRKLDDRCFS